ncbi:MAG: hypothetical protein PHG05_04440 [Candidatus Nanoarchaeia archaeon]|nr:hypothetical protein [Candidatus Nanoarchaeia archaeon]
MECRFKKGYSVYEKIGKEMILICPHSGPALQSVSARDDNSETIASLVWESLGGKLVVSNISRNRLFGVDFNRDIPPLKTATNSYDFFSNSEDDKVSSYMKKYAWVAKDEREYYEKLKIYQDFWAEVKDEKYILLIHRAFDRMKFVPSLMDITIFTEAKIQKKKVQEIISKINTKYYPFLKSIETDYKNAILAETKRMILNILRIHENSFDIHKMEKSFREILLKDLEKIERYSDKIALNRLRNNFIPGNYIEAVRYALNNVPVPEITLENVFDGSSAFGPKRKLFPVKDRIVLQVEPCLFLNFWHPQMAAKILQNIIEELEKL